MSRRTTIQRALPPVGKLAERPDMGIRQLFDIRWSGLGMTCHRPAKRRRPRLPRMPLWLTAILAMLTALGIFFGGIGQLLQGIAAMLH